MNLSVYRNPQERGLKPFRIRFRRPESAPIRSMLDEGFIYRNPERIQEATVWVKEASEIPQVLNFHFGIDWFGLERVNAQVTWGRTEVSPGVDRPNGEAPL
jgi:hypothetical protein